MADTGNTNANAKQSPSFTGQAIKFACPSCGEELWMFIPADPDGDIEVVRSRDLPREDEEDDVPSGSTGDS
ncbi:MAG TPA: hypothetical protein VF116_23455 [Ktedonobacterales bacterium]